MDNEVPVTWPFWIAGLMVAAGLVCQWMQATTAPGRWVFLLLAVLVLVSLVLMQMKRPQQPH